MIFDDFWWWHLRLSDCRYLMWCRVGVDTDRKRYGKRYALAQSKNRSFSELRRSCVDLRSMLCVVLYYRSTLRMYLWCFSDVFGLSEKKIRKMHTIFEISSQFSDATLKSNVRHKWFTEKVLILFDLKCKSDRTAFGCPRWRRWDIAPISPEKPSWSAQINLLCVLGVVLVIWAPTRSW